MSLLPPSCLKPGMLPEAREQSELGQGTFEAGSGKRETFLELFVHLRGKLTPWEPEEGGEPATTGDGDVVVCATEVQTRLGNQPQQPHSPS